MAAITVYAQSNGDWDKADNWNTVAGGGGTAYTNPQDGENAFTCELNGKTINLQVGGNPTTIIGVTLIRSDVALGVVTLPTGGNCTINGDVNHGNASVLCGIGTGKTLTINGTLTNSGTGRSFQYTAGTLNINKVGTALVSTGSNLTIMASSTAACTITGDISMQGSYAYGAIRTFAGTTTTITGNMTATTAVPVIRGEGGTINFTGLPLQALGSTATPAVNLTGGGTFTWSGTHTVSEDQYVFFDNRSGTLNVSSLILNNRGTVVIHVLDATTFTIGSCKIIQQSPTAEAVIWSKAHSGVIINSGGYIIGS